MCLYPGWIRSWWISSATTMTPYSLQISPILRSSSSVQTRPVGFWGEQRKNIMDKNQVGGTMLGEKVASRGLPPGGFPAPCGRY